MGKCSRTAESGVRQQSEIGGVIREFEKVGGMAFQWGLQEGAVWSSRAFVK
jgi:hypothetical protein